MSSEPNIFIKEDFVKNPDDLFLKLKNEVAWDERMKSRKTASFGVSYDYSGIEYPETEMSEELIALCRNIEFELNFYPNNCLLNFYKDGNSSMGFHSDSSEELAENTGVAIISLGAERIITYKNKIDKKITFDYLLKNGALLYMKKSIQAEWLHAIPKQENVDERVSLTFRQIIK